ncbi:CheR family methyltransferase [Alkalimonas delamerensis]|uniref:Chemotaxis protein methyltransferase n=1 Tax=Alkalimonas delamerensis TaxID=265981 RepID=A0ABT9GNK5_9GAMM|nr:CheR family methyltransferase [Alkalimonas delamerensis]MDP4528504.1 CheR family methyltransferase [Alkalimonas delamerensis]
MQPQGAVEREFAYSKADFDAVRKQLHLLTGIRLADSKDSMVYSRLVRRIRALRLSGFAAYLTYLDKHPEETEQFINALTTNLTSFFREPHHFEVLSTYLKKHPGQINIWCAASSTGEEPYSIAMVVAETFGRFDAPVQIIATDIDSQVLQKAQAGIYRADRLQGLDERRCKQFFFRGKGSQTGFVKVVPELQKMVQFRQLNLLDAKWHIRGPFDLIFCRNVMIYFDKPTQLKLLERMVRLLTPSGLYIAGHSENFAQATHLVKAIGQTTYRPAGGVLG